MEDSRNILSKLDMVAVLSAKDIYEYIMQPFPIGLGSFEKYSVVNDNDQVIVW